MRTKQKIMKSTIVITALMLCVVQVVLDVQAESFQSTEDVSFTFEPSVNISITGGDLSIASLSPGSSSDSNIITVSASSNAIHGYTLTSTVGSSSNTSAELRRDGTETSTDRKFTSLTANKAALDGFSSSDWGYSYSTDSGSTWVSGDVGSTSSGYNGYTYNGSSSYVTHINASSNGSSSFQYKIGAKASGTQVAGEYTNVINFIGTGKVVTTNYTISYNANGGTGAPANQTGSTTNGAVALSSTLPTKAGYSFKGWCTVDNTTDPAACSGITVKSGGLMALNSGSSASVTKTVYAVWGTNMKYIQNLAASDCVNTAPTKVVDSRDGEEYLVQRLADGKCWMLDNLTLGSSSVIALTPNDTNIANNWTLPAMAWDEFDSYTTAKIDTSFKNDVPENAPSGSLGSNKVGVYYNYCAASGGSICDSSNSNNASYDICPKGWRMPTGGSSGEYGVLYAAYNNAGNFMKNLSTPMSGYYDYVSASSIGAAGWFWSSTRYDNSKMYLLKVDYDNTVDLYNTDISRMDGASVRCVLKRLISFTISGTTYQAQEGMTWGQWVNSDYNTDGFYVDGGYVVTGSGSVRLNNSPESSSSIIQENAVYTIGTGHSTPE